MSKLRLSSASAVAGLVLAATVLAFATPAAGGPPAVASGSLQFIPTSFTTRSADGNVFVRGTGLLINGAGTITGTASETYRFVIHKDGSIEGVGKAVCPCTIGSRSGSFDSVFTMHGSVGSDEVSGRVTITGASGSLAGTHGGGFYQQSFSTGSGSYSFNLVFTP